MRQAATVQGADHAGVASMAHHELPKCGSFDAAPLLEDLGKDCRVT
jgi:hypothetical protein